MGFFKWLFGGKSKPTTHAPQPQSPVASSGVAQCQSRDESPAPAAETEAESNDIESLARDAWRAYDACKEEYVVEPSMPILFFGDGAAYRQSVRKVITVGKNPSF